MSAARAVELPVRRSQADWSYTAGQSRGDGLVSVRHSFRSVLVDPDGTVRAWDEIAGYYSIHHDLTPEQVAEAQQLAAVP